MKVGECRINREETLASASAKIPELGRATTAAPRPSGRRAAKSKLVALAVHSEVLNRIVSQGQSAGTGLIRPTRPLTTSRACCTSLSTGSRPTSPEIVRFVCADGYLHQHRHAHRAAPANDHGL